MCLCFGLDVKGNAERSRIVMVGDTLKKGGDSSKGDGLVAVEDYGDTKYEESRTKLIKSCLFTM